MQQIISKVWKLSLQYVNNVLRDQFPCGFTFNDKVKIRNFNFAVQNKNLRINQCEIWRLIEVFLYTNSCSLEWNKVINYPQTDGLPKMLLHTVLVT